MIGPLVSAVVALSLLLAAWAGVQVARDRLPPRGLLQGLILLQLLLMVQAGIAAARLLEGAEVASLGSFLGYLVVSLVAVPAGMFLAVEERSRWGTAVLGVACLVVAVVVGRLLAVWTAGA